MTGPDVGAQRVAGALGAVVSVTSDGRDRARLDGPDGPDGLATANALVVLRRCAVNSARRGATDGLDEQPVTRWAADHHLGMVGSGRGQSLLDAVRARREAAARSLAAAGYHVLRFTVAPEAAVLLGAAEGGIRNVGLRLHGTYGWPVLPASSLKGAARNGGGEDDSPGPEAATAFGTQSERGAVAVLDALPGAVPPRVVADVLTPHAQPYYRDTDDPDQTNPRPPAEYWSPVPVPFLSVTSGGAGHWEVYLASRDPVALRTACRRLRTAVDQYGLGAKTSAGYGYLICGPVELVRAKP